MRPPARAVAAAVAAAAVDLGRRPGLQWRRPERWQPPWQPLVWTGADALVRAGGGVGGVGRRDGRCCGLGSSPRSAAAARAVAALVAAAAVDWGRRPGLRRRR